MSQILLIAKDAKTRDELRLAALQAGVSVEPMEDFEPALAEIQKEAPVLVLAENPPSDEIMEKLVATLKSHAPVTPLLVYIHERDTTLALKRMTQGAYDCLCAPVAAGDLLAAGKRAVMRLGRRLLTSRVVRRKSFWERPAVLVPGVMAVLVLVGVVLRGLWAPVFQTYKLGSDHAVALSGDADSLWVADWSQPSLTQFVPKGNFVSIVNVRKFGDMQPVAVSVAPYYIYTVSLDGNLRRHRRDEAFTVTASVPAPGPAVTGLAWDGENLWSCDAENAMIYQHDNKLEVIAKIPSPMPKPVGLAWAKKSLWVADGEKNVLWRLKRRGAEWQKTGPYTLEAFAQNKNLNLSGFTLWHGAAWFVSEEDGLLIKHKFPSEP